MPAIAFGRFDDSFSASSLKAYLAEFISTLLFVFAGVGSAIAYSYYTLYHLFNLTLIVACSVVFESFSCMHVMM